MVEREKLDHIEERLRAIERGEDHAFVDMAELCLVPNVIIPPKFKVPDFDKYKGTTCPKNHLELYYRKIGASAKDEKLLMQYHLMVAFVRQYQYNSDTAPDRMQLQNMGKKGHKSFKEYAQSWRDLAGQVAPPMTEKEMITMIVDTLPVFYYEKMVGYTPSSFADLVFVDKRIEVGLKRRKFDYPTFINEKPGANREDEKEGGTHVVIVVPTWPNFPPTQQYQYSANISLSHYPPPYQPRTTNHP